MEEDRFQLPVLGNLTVAKGTSRISPFFKSKSVFFFLNKCFLPKNAIPGLSRYSRQKWHTDENAYVISWK